MQNEIREMAGCALRCCEADEKLAAVRRLSALRRGEGAVLDTQAEPVPVEKPGMPAALQLIRASRVPRRGFGTREGRAIMMHAIAHIEFNAINLALDAAHRFAGMPVAFYQDWISVAEEEAYHFELIRAHLRHHGGEYGDYTAHGGLWEMCERTAHDVMSRMALVPRVLEARGLDVTPGIQEKLTQAGDHHAVSLLDIIMRDEIGHVEIGNRWFHYCCEQRDLDAQSTFESLLAQYYPKGLLGPFNMEARREAGFSEFELSLLAGQ